MRGRGPCRRGRRGRSSPHRRRRSVSTPERVKRPGLRLPPLDAPFRCDRRGRDQPPGNLPRHPCRSALGALSLSGPFHKYDASFEAKAGRILDLYAGCWEGKPLAATEYVISTDEKTSIQARCRCHATLPPAAARAMRVEHEYERCGALQYLAAWDCHRGKVLGRCEEHTGIEPFGRLVAQVMQTEPYASARRVF